jgi:hypothetical protein
MSSTLKRTAKSAVGGLLIGAAACAGPPASTEIDSVEQPAQIAPESLTAFPVLGDGWDTAAQDVRGPCVRASGTVPIAPSDARVFFDRTVDESFIRSELDIDVGSKGMYKLVSGSAAAKINRAITADEYSEIFILGADYNLGGVALDGATIANTAIGEDAARGNAWQETCGDEVVSQMLVGARLYYVMRIEFASREEKRRFEREVGASILGKKDFLEIKERVQATASTFARSAKVRVEVFQIGGDVTRLGSIFESWMDGKRENGHVIVNCDITNLSACDKLRENAVAYVGDRPGGMAEQLRDPKVRPNPIKYITQPWTNFRRNTVPKLFTAELNAARASLTDKYQRLAATKVRVGRLLGTAAFYGLPEEQVGDLQALDTQVSNKLGIVNDAVAACFNGVRFDAGGRPINDSVTACRQAVDAVPHDEASAKVLTAVAHYAIQHVCWNWSGGSECHAPDVSPVEIPDRTGFVAPAPTVGGRIYWTPETGAHLASAAIVPLLDAAGGPARVGFPKQDPIGYGGDAVENVFEQASFFSRGGGATWLTGPVLEKYSKTGGVVGLLGFPTDGQHVTPDGRGRFAHFDRGSIYAVGDRANVVLGAIRQHWADNGWEQGVYGFPTSDENANGSWRWSDFESGSIYFDLTRGATFPLPGPIGLEYQKVRGAGWIGVPVREVRNIPLQGQLAEFQGGAIYASARTGAHALGRGLFDYFRFDHGAGVEPWMTAAPAGLPVTGEVPVKNVRGAAGVLVKLERGRIYWSPTTGANLLAPPFLDAWFSKGGEESRCGFPKTGPFLFEEPCKGILCSTGIKDRIRYYVQEFEFGNITVNLGGGVRSNNCR